MTLRMFTFDMVKNFEQILMFHRMISSCLLDFRVTIAFCLSNEKLQEEGDGCEGILKGDQVCESHMRTGAGQKSNIS